MQPNKQISRRSFLKKTTGAAVGVIGFPYIVSSSALGQAGGVAASERITLGFIGTGGRGGSLLRNFLHLSDAKVVALCDVKRQNRDRAKETVDKQYKTTGCSAYTDFRELVARNDIDACWVASPDTWHVLHAMASLRA